MKKTRASLDDVVSLLTIINDHLVSIEVKLSPPVQEPEPEPGTDLSDPALAAGMLAVTQAASKPSSFGHLA